jgi:hypothetical protein
MAVVFKSEKHEYVSQDPSENIKWTSVTSFISQFKQPFDKVGVATKVSKSKKSKWYGKSVEEILEAWKYQADVAIDRGNWYHNQREADLLSIDSISRYGKELPVINPIIDDIGKIAPSQKLMDGVYPEHFVYLKSVGLCGQSDLVTVVDNRVNILDYKTNKEIKTESYVNWEGVSQKMVGPVVHLDDCNFNHYALQLSVYMYIILKHNPKLKPGSLTLHHVLFYEDGQDEYGTPILKRDENGEPVVKKIVPYDVPYLKDEVITLIKYKQNAD